MDEIWVFCFQAERTSLLGPLGAVSLMHPYIRPHPHIPLPPHHPATRQIISLFCAHLRNRGDYLDLLCKLLSAVLCNESCPHQLPQTADPRTRTSGYAPWSSRKSARTISEDALGEHPLKDSSGNASAVFMDPFPGLTDALRLHCATTKKLNCKIIQCSKHMIKISILLTIAIEKKKCTNAQINVPYFNFM